MAEGAAAKKRKYSERKCFAENAIKHLGKASGLRAGISEGGLLMNLCHGETLITRTSGSLAEGALTRIYLRCLQGESCTLVPVFGPTGICNKFMQGTDQVDWQGHDHGIDVRISMKLGGDEVVDWFVHAQALDSGIEAIDCIFGLDLGLADTGALKSNEAYICHYVDQHVETTNAYGPVLMYRQNLPQSDGGHPWLMLYSPTGATAYATDAHDAFGNAYRLDNLPRFADGSALFSKIRQYEYNYATLQSQRHSVTSGQNATFQFRAIYQNDHPAISSAADLQIIQTLAIEAATFADKSVQVPVKSFRLLKEAAPYPASDCKEETLKDLFTDEWKHVERNGLDLLSFFTGEATHVVTRRKEGLVDRGHGTILLGAKELLWDKTTTAITPYMNGNFGSQIVSGNTSFHKFNSVARETLGLNRTSGQRIFICVSGRWHQLGTPSVFVMERDKARWIYRNAHLPTVEVIASIQHNNREIVLQLESSSPLDEVLVTNELVMGNNEPDLDVRIHQHDESNTWEIYPDENRSATPPAFRLKWNSDSEQVAEESSGKFGAPVNLLCLACASVSQFSLTISPLVNSSEKAPENPHFWDQLSKGLKLSNPDDRIDRLNTALKWYAHNACIHYLSPHGLEQYTGAAWGTRDACQGPFELLLSQGHFHACKDILKKIFSAQYLETGDWPQWFMLEEYAHIAQDHSHGDIILWPLHALALYLIRTADFDFLEEEIDFRVRNPVNQAAFSPKPLFDHMVMAIDYMVKQFVGDTRLISYGDGDWNDSLQPAKTDLRKQLVSSWTVALSAQVATELADALQRSNYPDVVEFLVTLRNDIERDFRKYLIVDGTLCGFLLFDESFKNATPLIHPSDTRTGISLRLIPINRAIIAGLFTAEEAESHLRKVTAELAYPDGVRLMTRPAAYCGGKENFFRRAETAANFGREIGLQYVHAHIRYAEALAIMGKADELWQALQIINPVGIHESVANAEVRQSNMYFSSSDGAFNTRYDADNGMDHLKAGKIASKGGWRLYSSGPGIYTSLVIERLLGLRQFSDHWEIDPVLPLSLHNLSLKWNMDGHDVDIIYKVAESGDHTVSLSVNDAELKGELICNPYRDAGLCITKVDLLLHMKPHQNRIVINC